MNHETWTYTLLDTLNIPYERLDHEPISSVKDTDIVLPGQQVKNLCLKTKKGKDYYLIILKDEKIADLKQLATLLGKNRLSFVNEEELANLLHVTPGTVTPFGLHFDTEQKIQVIIDKEVDPTLTVGFHPFINTTTLNIAYSDFLRFLEYTNHSPLIISC
ncbi:prolyl-tRNA synthetase associated domain-containing protein [Granulicatella sp. zg-ZJ]|uniref:prolyl-tRNA synthetase associated domain-containing protein n=1 Tax=unclassified Granulicatella TaxID=2630493 RepID=UPI0013BFE4A1|nr:MULTISPECIES: YbaK/EbsC family protein [unclassified Granulicatella]MBS4750402.1 prolyl-tRNA synthetase associated domain-containing protein [Carnobacteriaceae bacterium zg-ZUI78]NEW61997.1 prolyl-tRNA synthetase associated domain-containing protein [Granulicatella sp. zg-ZJ]NEW65610.1 prolyl-tRNA synthetase associated domain-containing protein [Granulicatella sp. zg-84]QMI85749.1 prolyl-tRNA synthetase associated domain-containing protein [Carnobacteriaceae bacterium zg-84]